MYPLLQNRRGFEKSEKLIWGVYKLGLEEGVGTGEKDHKKTNEIKGGERSSTES